MSTLQDAIHDYLSERQAGIQLRKRLLRFGRFMEQKKATTITTKLAVEFVQRSEARPLGKSQNMSAVRAFARFRSQADPLTEVPPYGVIPYPPKPVPKIDSAVRSVTAIATERSPLRQAILEYLSLRRSLGYKLRLAGMGLIDFAAFMEERSADFVTVGLALEWAQKPYSAKPETWAQRLGFIRDFARHRIASDSRTEIPGWGLLPHGKKRARPYLYTEKEIVDLLDAALQLPVYGHPGYLKRQTYYCLLGLLTVTGMRISEVLGLTMGDIDIEAGVLTVKGSKFGQSRYVPLHPSVLPVLSEYLKFRDRYMKTHGRHSKYFFTKYSGGKIDQSDVNRTFHKLCRMTGLQREKNGPRIHDLRHRFAVETLLRWYRSGEDVERKLPLLSTYLGHVKPKDTYWYLTSCPELMGEAARLLERRWEDQI